MRPISLLGNLKRLPGSMFAFVISVVAAGCLSGDLSVATSDYRFVGLPNTEDRVGGSFEDIGDVDGDGRRDFAIGGTGGVGVPGRVWVFTRALGANRDVAVTSAAFTVTGTSMGQSVFAVGDVTGDGIDDFAISELSVSNGRGATYIFDGRRNRAPGAMLTVNDAWATFTGTQDNELVGQSVVAGDFDGDGRRDLAIGAYGYSDSRGAVYIVYGGANGIPRGGSLGAFARLRGPTRDVDLNNRPAFGTSIAALDFNGDGRTDLAIGAPNETDRIHDIYASGAVHLLYGLNQRFPNGATTDVAPLIQHAIFRGNAFLQAMGSRVVRGDFNADGYDDLAFGAPYTGCSININCFGTQSRVFVTLGRPNSGIAFPLLGNVFLDGVGDDRNCTEFRAPVSKTTMAGAFLSNARDINGDGKEDLAIGSHNNEGWLLYGYVGASAWAHDPYTLGDPSFALHAHFIGNANAPGTAFRLTGIESINGDNFDELAIGASGATINQSFVTEGEGYLFFGESDESVGR